MYITCTLTVMIGWKWENTNGIALQDALTPTDRKLFGFDMSNIHWPSYIESMCLGVKKFLLKESLQQLPAARMAQRKLMVINFLFKMLGFHLIIKVLAPFFEARGFKRNRLWGILPLAALSHYLTPSSGTFANITEGFSNPLAI